MLKESFLWVPFTILPENGLKTESPKRKLVIIIVIDKDHWEQESGC